MKLVSMNKEILRLAIPNIIANITVPLLGMVDMAIVGHLDSQAYIGAIATASLIFNFIYWGFSFLRMGTSGFTAQAFGSKNKKMVSETLFRSLLIALLVGISIILLQKIIFNTAFRLIHSTEEVTLHAHEYFSVYIWSAPAVFGLYTFFGWFVGMQDARTPMIISILINIVNIFLSLFFVYVLDLSIKGVAWASLIAQYTGLSLAVVFMYFKYKNIQLRIDWQDIFHIASYIPFFKVNADIFIRTALLIGVTTFFTSISAKMGNSVLAANALLMQLFTLFSYMMDGFAYAAEALTGRFVGERKMNYLQYLIRNLFVWGTVMAIIFALSYGIFTEQIIGVLTDKTEIIEICKQYRGWVSLIPIAGFAAFLWDGIFVGATASRQMRNSMCISAMCFFIVHYCLYTVWGNNALWLAFIIYLAMRGIIQFILYRTSIIPSLLKI